MDDLVDARPQPHLDPVVSLVVDRDVIERFEVEVGAELAVHDLEDVLVERLGHALRIVICGLQPADVLDEIGTEQEVVVAVQAARDGAEETTTGVGEQVADRPTEEDDEATAVVREQLQVAVEVADNGFDLDAGILVLDRARGFVQRLFAHVEGREAAQRSFITKCVEQQARLRAPSRAQFDQRLGARQPRDITCVRLQDHALRARRVVLGKARDLVEQLGAAVVVEPLRRQLLR